MIKFYKYFRKGVNVFNLIFGKIKILHFADYKEIMAYKQGQDASKF